MNLEFNLDLKGLDIIENRIDIDFKRLLYNCMKKMQELTIRRCPVDTGQMRRSIKLVPYVYGSREYVLNVGVNYAVHVEYGTMRMIQAHGVHDPEHPITDWAALRKRGGSGQTMPFLRPAFLEVKRVWLERYWRALI